MVNSKLRRHKVMEKAIKKLMGNNLPPRFKFKDTYDSIEVPTEYQQYLPTQQQLETEFDEMLDQEAALPTIDAVSRDLQVISANVYSNTATGAFGIGTATPDYTLHVDGDAGITSNLTVGTANLFVDTVTGKIGVGTDTPAYTLDVYGTANVGALTATSVSGSGSGLTALNAGNLASGTVPSARLNLAASDIPSLNASKITTGTIARPVTTTGGVSAASLTTHEYIYHNGDTNTAIRFPAHDTITMQTAGSERMRVTSTGNVGIGTDTPAYTLDVYGTANTGALTATTGAFSGDINCRLVRPNYTNQATISGAMAYRINNSNDNYIRFCSDKGAIRTFLDVPTRTGGNASGTWGINITGNADTVDNLHASSFLRSDADDTVNAGVTYSWAATDTHGLQFENSSHTGYYLYIGGWSSSSTNNISRIRHSNGNLHIDSAANGHLYLNNYSAGQVISKGNQNILQSTQHNYMQATNYNYLQGQRNYLQSQLNYIQGQKNYIQGEAHLNTGSYIAGSRFETYGSGSNKVCRIKNTEDDDSVYYAFRNQQSILQREVTAVIQGYMQHSSDDRIKTNEQHLTDGLDVIKRLKPQRYDKLHDLLENQDPTSNSYGLSEKHETGFIAQDIYYEIPELRHLVHVGGGYIPDENVTIPDDPTQDPDYSSWGNVAASVSYTEIIPYNTAAIQDLSKLRDDDVNRISILENQLLDIVSRLETLESKAP